MTSQIFSATWAFHSKFLDSRSPSRDFFHSETQLWPHRPSMRTTKLLLMVVAAALLQVSSAVANCRFERPILPIPIKAAAMRSFAPRIWPVNMEVVNAAVARISGSPGDQACSFLTQPHARPPRDLKIQLIDVLLIDYQRRAENDFAPAHFERAQASGLHRSSAGRQLVLR